MQLLSFFALGIDSFLGGLAIGSFTRGWVRRLSLAATFGLCDGAATLIGHWFGLHGPLQAIPMLSAYLTLVFFTSAFPWRIRDKVFVLPLVLSIDNLVWSNAASTPMPLALSSALMAWCGLSLGLITRKAFTRLRPWVRVWLTEYRIIGNTAFGHFVACRPEGSKGHGRVLVHSAAVNKCSNTDLSTRQSAEMTAN
jgi:hypothetical protein